DDDPIDAGATNLLEHRFERGKVAVNVVERRDAHDATSPVSVRAPTARGWHRCTAEARAVSRSARSRVSSFAPLRSDGRSPDGLVPAAPRPRPIVELPPRASLRARDPRPAFRLPATVRRGARAH